MTEIDTRAYDLLPVQAWVARADGGLEYVNPAVATYLGMTVQRIVADGWRGVCHPLDLTTMSERWQRALATGEVFEAQFRLPCGRARQYRWHLARAVAVRDASGRIARWVGTNTDIDLVKRGEEVGQASAARAQASRARLLALLAQAPVAITVTRGPEHMVELANEVARRVINGRNLEGRVLAESLPELVGQGVLNLLDEVYRTGQARQVRELPVRYAPNGDGQMTDGWFDISYEPLRDAAGMVDGVMAVSVDVTLAVQGRLQVERLLRERAAVLQQLGEGVIITDREGRITFVNQVAEAAHGCALLDVPPERYSEAYQLFTEDGAPYPPHELPLARAILHDEIVCDSRWTIHRADGSVFHAIGNARPVLDGEGNKIGAVLTLRDAGARAG